MAYITSADLDPFADIDSLKAEAMIDDAVAQAVLVAPCLADADDLDTHQKAAVKGVLRRAILRWHEAGVGGVVQSHETAGPFSRQETVSTNTSRGLFWPSEIEQLQKVCEQVKGGTGGAFSIDTAPSLSNGHAITCSLVFGATYCSCGADIAGVPLWGTP